MPTIGSVATVEEIKDICPGATGEFINEMLRVSATPATALTAWIPVQNATIVDLRTKLDASELEREELLHATIAIQRQRIEVLEKRLGITDRYQPQNTNASAVAEFEKAVSELMAMGLTKSSAVIKIVENDPDLHARYIEEINSPD